MNRRKLLIGAAGAGVALAVPVVAMAVPVDPVPALAAEYFRLFDHCNNSGGTEEEVAQNCKLVHAAFNQLSDTPASTITGLHAKLKVLKFEIEGSMVKTDDPLFIGIMADAERLAGGTS